MYNCVCIYLSLYIYIYIYICIYIYIIYVQHPRVIHRMSSQPSLRPTA